MRVAIISTILSFQLPTRWLGASEQDLKGICGRMVAAYCNPQSHNCQQLQEDSTVDCGINVLVITVQLSAPKSPPVLPV